LQILFKFYFFKIFPKSNIKLCLFHFIKAVTSKKDELGLLREYKKNKNFKIWLRAFFGSSLLPAHLLPTFVNTHLQHFPALIDSANQPKIIEFLAYLRGQWIPLIPFWCQVRQKY